MTESNGEISLKEVYLSIQQWWKYLLSKWIIIIILGTLGGGIGLLYVLNKKPVYIGSLTFVLANDSKANIGGLASLAGQFGVDVGGGSNGAFEGENIIELLKSRHILKGALFKVIPGEKLLLINMIGNELGFFGRWEKNQRLARQIPFPNEIAKLTLVQDSLINVIHAGLIKNNLSIIKTDKKLSFYEVSTTSEGELISILLTKNIVSEAAKMYIETKTKTARENLSMLQHEADSIRSRLNGTIYATANHLDETFNLNIALQAKRAPIQENQIQLQVLGAAYGEVVKNLEIAKITLQKETPLYQVIDEPSLPLTRIKISKLKGGIVGIFVGTLLCICVLVGRKKIKEIAE